MPSTTGDSASTGDSGSPAAPLVAAPAVNPSPDLDSLATAFGAQADTLPVAALPALEVAIRDWLERLEFEDPVLLPPGGDPSRYFRSARGRLLDALGRSAFRRRDLRQAEAALVSAESQLNSRGTTSGYARHFLHLGDVHAARGRWDAAIAAYLDAEVRGLGRAATAALEAAFQRRYGTLRGVERLRARERERVADERQQQVLVGAVALPLLPFTYPRRTGPPLASGAFAGAPLVVALWDDVCDACGGYGGRLAPLAAALRARRGQLLGIWLGSVPSGAGPPQPFAIVLPPDPAVARRRFGVERLPALLVVDGRGVIRYRHQGSAAEPPPLTDILLQLDHIERGGS
ncbi:MAG: hypothetical protein ABR559_03105 [Gemmatimonadota bacterium]